MEKTRILYGGYIYELKKPLYVEFTYSGPYVQLDCPELSIYSVGATYEEAFEAFAQEVAFVWKEYAEENDARLSGDALELKHWLLANMRKVPADNISCRL